jgi:putative transposase
LDQGLAEIYAALLDEGFYHCSIPTMYRLLGQHGGVRERRRQLRHPVYQKPELLAENPNEVWSWDITKLMGPTKWSYFYLYDPTVEISRIRRSASRNAVALAFIGAQRSACSVS